MSNGYRLVPGMLDDHAPQPHVAIGGHDGDPRDLDATDQVTTRMPPQPHSVREAAISG